MESTPAHERHNPDLLRLMPLNAVRVVEIGCSSGALAREYKCINPACCYVGVEVEPRYTTLAKRHCDHIHTLDIELAEEPFFRDVLAGDCWVFGDSLEHLRDPWQLLTRVRRSLTPRGCIVACIPNAQHWSIQVRLNRGEFNYEDAGLLDRTHLRWFTRKTIIEMFRQCGYRIDAGIPRIFHQPQGDKVLAAIRAFAAATGTDPDTAVADAVPLQYVVRARPSQSG